MGEIERHNKKKGVIGQKEQNKHPKTKLKKIEE